MQQPCAVLVHTYMLEQTRSDLASDNQQEVAMGLESPASALPSPMMELTTLLPTVLPLKPCA